MGVNEFISLAIKDRYALIVPETLEIFARQHIHEILKTYPCTGILLMQNRPGVCFHLDKKKNIDEIARNGLKESVSDQCTFGSGVIYCYSSIDRYEGIVEGQPLYRIFYSKCLRSIYKDDCLYDDWEEWLVKKKDIISYDLLGTDGYNNILKRLSGWTR